MRHMHSLDACIEHILYLTLGDTCDGAANGLDSGHKKECHRCYWD